jgi:alpha-glucosidase (family GH31 glycosyl hydrolase)
MLGQATLWSVAIVWLRLTPTVLATPVYQLGNQDLLARQDEPEVEVAAESEEPAIIQIPSPVNHTGNVDACQGYQLVNSTTLDGGAGLDGTLEIIGNCSAYGPDYETLYLTVRYETDDRIRVRIVDSEGAAHIVPSDVAQWPEIGTTGSTNDSSNLSFEWEENPFSFRITRKSDSEVIFDTTGQPLIFEEQYLRVRSALAEGSHIQGLGQHNDNFT